MLTSASDKDTSLFPCADDDCRKYLERQKDLPVQVPEVDSRHQDRRLTINDGV